jgi:hypothetical protein
MAKDHASHRNHRHALQIVIFIKPAPPTRWNEGQIPDRGTTFFASNYTDL